MRIASLRRPAAVAAAIALLGGLSGCYIVPLQPLQPLPPGVPGPGAAVAPAPLTFTARLYPANDLAGPYGMVSAVVSNDLNGRGHFSAAIGGENFSGEATRVAGSQRDGMANGAGNRGSFLNCRYTLNSPTLGTGRCELSNGALFSMHIGG